MLNEKVVYLGPDRFVGTEKVPSLRNMQLATLRKVVKGNALLELDNKKCFDLVSILQIHPLSIPEFAADMMLKHTLASC